MEESNLNYLVIYDDGESIEEFADLIGNFGAYARFEMIKALKVPVQLYGWDWATTSYRLLDEDRMITEPHESPYRLIDEKGQSLPFTKYEEAAKRIKGLMREGIASEQLPHLTIPSKSTDL